MKKMNDKNSLSSQPDAEIIDAHKHCTCNKDEILASDSCGCFHCLKIFSSSEISNWLKEGDRNGEDKFTAFCPCCDIDAVLGSKSGYPITLGFLRRMREYWFDGVAR